MTKLREGDHLIRLVLANLTHQPLRKFELHNGWYQPVGLLGQMSGDEFAGR
jgi:hypothetical protein